MTKILNYISLYEIESHNYDKEIENYDVIKLWHNFRLLKYDINRHSYGKIWDKKNKNVEIVIDIKDFLCHNFDVIS